MKNWMEQVGIATQNFALQLLSELHKKKGRYTAHAPGQQEGVFLIVNQEDNYYVCPLANELKPLVLNENDDVVLVNNISFGNDFEINRENLNQSCEKYNFSGKDCKIYFTVDATKPNLRIDAVRRIA